jgi:hypothetical protein
MAEFCCSGRRSPLLVHRWFGGSQRRLQCYQYTVCPYGVIDSIWLRNMLTQGGWSTLVHYLVHLPDRVVGSGAMNVLGRTRGGKAGNRKEGKEPGKVVWGGGVTIDCKGNRERLTSCFDQDAQTGLGGWMGTSRRLGGKRETHRGACGRSLRRFAVHLREVIIRQMRRADDVFGQVAKLLRGHWPVVGRL